ncbi:MAG TPA: ABC transporter permease [Rhizobiaceae bacterium]|nr:ABC transporter permease [Rhizobiaceae bacterium]
MLKFFVVRSISLLPLCVLIVTIAFTLLHLVPGDPAVVMLGIDATPERIAEMQTRLGLDRPFLERYLVYLANVAQGDLGYSNFLSKDVLPAIVERLPVSLLLAAMSLFWAVLLGVPAGVFAAAHRGSLIDRAVMFSSLAGMSIPSFWFGLILIMVVGVWFGVLPTGGYVSPFENPWEALKHMMLPSLSLGFIQMAQVARMTRSAMLEILRQDYILVARAKGMPEFTILFNHALRNGLTSILTVLALIFAEVLGGALVTEQIFSLPGLGQLIVSAVGFRDYPVIQGSLVVVGIAYVLINTLTDAAYRIIDPRIRDS